MFEAAAELLSRGKRSEAVAFVDRAIEAGNPDALFQQAMWWLIGDPLPRNLPMARTALAKARVAGQIDAALIEAALTANGTGARPDWSVALMILQSAARVSPIAEDQLAVLKAMKLDPQGSPLTVSKPVIIGEQPTVGVHRAMLTRPECAAVANAVADILSPTLVADPQTGRLIAHPIRTSDGAVVGPTRENLVIRAVNLRLAAITQTDVRNGESLSVLRYSPGQEYRPHVDTLPHVANQRVKTALIYLNENYAGGETRFEASGVTYKGRTGDVIVFDNVLPDGRPDPRSRHSGLPVTDGVKWLATRWIRAKPLDPWDPATAS